MKNLLADHGIILQLIIISKMNFNFPLVCSNIVIIFWNFLGIWLTYISLFFIIIHFTGMRMHVINNTCSLNFNYFPFKMF